MRLPRKSGANSGWHFLGAGRPFEKGLEIPLMRAPAESPARRAAPVRAKRGEDRDNENFCREHPDLPTDFFNKIGQEAASRTSISVRKRYLSGPRFDYFVTMSL